MGKLYGERWESVNSIGEGGQAHTFLVVDRKGGSDTQYVLKRLKNAKRLERFKREIEAIRNLSHPNIVRLIDFNLGATQPYLVMEYCSGGSLSQAGKFWNDSPVAGLRLFRQILEGIAYAHTNNIIHRDIKPDNIFLRGENNTPVVGDFGICFVEEDGSRLTLTEEAVGPRLFIAPELEDGRIEKISRKSDIYSLGKVLYWLLSGGKIFGREKHRDPNWDLKGKDSSSRLGWKNIYMEHVNRLLDFMITTEPSDRYYITDIITGAEEIIRLVEEEYNPVSTVVPQPCYYCGLGRYVMRVDGGIVQVKNFGINPVGANDWRVLVCNMCGHVQSFRIDLATRIDWWET